MGIGAVLAERGWARKPQTKFNSKCHHAHISALSSCFTAPAFPLDELFKPTSPLLFASFHVAPGTVHMTYVAPISSMTRCPPGECWEPSSHPTETG